MLLKRSVSPLIATILIIVVVVILITIVLTWGKNFTNQSLVSSEYLTEMSDVGFFVVSNLKDNHFIIKNLYTYPLTITRYNILSDSNNSNLTNRDIYLTTPITIQPNGQSRITFPCIPNKEFYVNFITSDDKYISLKLTADFYNPDSCELSLSGSGVDGDPFRIYNVFQLNDVRNHLSDQMFFSLENDLDLNLFDLSYFSDVYGFEDFDTNGWLPIGDDLNNFTGSFNGNNYTISNLYINRPLQNYVGLFGYTSVGREIYDLTLNSVFVKGNDYVGALIGRNHNILLNISSSGEIIGNNYVGGVVGSNYQKIDASFATGVVTGQDYVGGVVGINYTGVPLFKNSYKGEISGSSYVGGITGFNRGKFSYNFSDSNITCTSSYCGGLVGQNAWSGYIYKSNTNSNVSGVNYVGGVTGYNYQKIDASFATGVVTGQNYVGGIAGNNQNSASINLSYFNGSVYGRDRVGGALGNNDSTLLVSESYSLGTVSGRDYVGGFVGYNNKGQLSKVYSLTDVLGTRHYVGGLVGYVNLSGDVSDSYSLSSVSGLNYVGGLVGRYAVSTITNSFSTGLVSTSGVNKGGLIGQLISGSIVDSYYDFQTSNQSDTDKGVPLSTSTLKQESTFSSWNFDSIWEIDNGVSYPSLLLKPYYPPLEKQGTNYKISYLEDLDLVRDYLDFDYILTRDLDFNDSSSYLSGEINIDWTTGSGWTSIGNTLNSFIGIFDGQNYSIKNLYVNRPSTDLASLFGSVYYGSEVKNLKLENVFVLGDNLLGSVTGHNFGVIRNISATGSISGECTGNCNIGGIVGANSGAYTKGYVYDSKFSGSVFGERYKVGGIVGNNWGGSVYNCYATGTIKGYGYIGGLVGIQEFLYKEKGIFDSFADCNVDGNIAVGGLVGVNHRTISNSYSLSRVDGNFNVGGFVGQNSEDITYKSEGIIKNSYSSGPVTRLTGSDTNFGGFVGYNQGSISNSYSLSTVSGNSWSPTDKGFAGAQNSNSVNYLDSNNYYNTETSLQTSTIGNALGKTTSEMKTQGTFTNWDFTNIWAINENITYPYLKIINYSVEFPLPQ